MKGASNMKGAADDFIRVLLSGGALLVGCARSQPSTVEDDETEAAPTVDASAGASDDSSEPHEDFQALNDSNNLLSLHESAGRIRRALCECEMGVGCEDMAVVDEERMQCELQVIVDYGNMDDGVRGFEDVGGWIRCRRNGVRYLLACLLESCESSAQQTCWEEWADQLCTYPRQVTAAPPEDILTPAIVARCGSLPAALESPIERE